MNKEPLTAEMKHDLYGDSAYTNTGGNVRRLTEEELNNKQLRKDNTYLANYMSYPYVPARPENRELEEEDVSGHPLKSRFTDYPNEAPIVRDHNVSLTGGSVVGGSFNSVMGDIGNIASAVAHFL